MITAIGTTGKRRGGNSITASTRFAHLQAAAAHTCPATPTNAATIGTHRTRCFLIATATAAIASTTRKGDASAIAFRVNGKLIAPSPLFMVPTDFLCNMHTPLHIAC
jgi:hypothetical protein